MKHSDLLSEAQGVFALACEVEAENRRAAADDIRFARLGEQWSPRVRAERQAEGRPCLTINRLPALSGRWSMTRGRTSPPLFVIRWGMAPIRRRRSC